MITLYILYISESFYNPTFFFLHEEVLLESQCFSQMEAMIFLMSIGTVRRQPFVESYGLSGQNSDIASISH